MMTPRSWRSGAALAVLLLLVLAGTASPVAVAQSEDDGLRVSATTTYVLLPGEERIAVTIDARLTNTLRTRTRGFVREIPYFDSVAVPTLGPVANASATSSSGRSLRTRVEQDDGVDVVVVSLGNQLTPNETQSVTIRFDLPGQPSRAESVTRVNRAFANWFVYGFGENGQNEIVVDLPRPFVVTAGTAAVRNTTFTEDRRIVTFSDVAEDDAAFFLSARHDDALTTTTVEVDGVEIEVKAWPNDPEWQEFAREAVVEGLPHLLEVVGQPLPEGGVTVVESSGGYNYGYAGFYLPEEQLVEVGDALDREVLLHELAHIWFNHELFSNRWITEGLAEVTAQRALLELGDDVEDPWVIDPDDPGALELNTWSNRAFGQPEIEAFGYRASHAAMDDIVAELGDLGLRELVAAATRHEIAWRGDREVELGKGSGDWRYFLDLAELVVGADGIRDVYLDHVLTPSQRQEVRDRDRALDDMQELDAVAPGWTTPFAVRTLLARWDFDRAVPAIAEAEGLLTRTLAVLEEYETVGAEPREVLERSFEASSSLSRHEGVLAEHEAFAPRLVSAMDRRNAIGPIEQVGLWGRDVRSPELVAAVDAGDLALAEEELVALTAVLDDAGTRGALLLGAALLLLLAGAAHLRRVVRGRRQAPVDVASGEVDEVDDVVFVIPELEEGDAVAPAGALADEANRVETDEVQPVG